MQVALTVYDQVNARSQISRGTEGRIGNCNLFQHKMMFQQADAVALVQGDSTHSLQGYATTHNETKQIHTRVSFGFFKMHL